MGFNLTRESKVVAFDVGLTGGMCFRSGTSIGAGPMPVLERIVNKKKVVTLNLELVTSYLKTNKPDLVGIELVHSMPKQGVASTFKFGMGYGQLQGICAALRIPFVLIAPQVWKKEMVGKYLELIKDEYAQIVIEIEDDSSLTLNEKIDHLKICKIELKKAKKYSSIVYVKSRGYTVNMYVTAQSKHKSDGIADAICIADFMLKDAK